VILTLLVVACSFSGSAAVAHSDTATAQQPSPLVRLFNLTTAHGIAGEKPFRPATVFAPDDDVIYLWYEAEGCAIGTTIRSTWYYLETDPPFQLADASVVVDEPGAWGQFNYKVTSGRRWAIGRYRIELRVDSQLMAETYFDVTPRATVQLNRGQADPPGLVSQNRWPQATAAPFAAH
jgi:hypothetical protein